jgi:hypothetical protein
MERTYKFLQLTLLGLIVGILIILLTQINVSVNLPAPSQL